MNFFSKKSNVEKQTEKVKVENVFVVKTEVVSNYNDGSGCGPMYATIYFLATKKEGKYYELFSGKRLDEKQSKDGCITMTFNTPFIEENKPLKEYLANPKEKEIRKDLLFDFIVYQNTLSQIGALEKE